jgi:methionyl aminopeptidase
LVATTQASREGLRRANQATAKLLQNLATLARPGVTTGDLNDYAMDYIAQLGAVPVFATEEGFPGCINTSVNDVAVHGVPGKQKLKIGDVLSIDAGMLLDGYAGDSTITIAVGKVSSEHYHLIETTRAAMMAGIQAARSGKHIGDIGYAIQSVAWSQGFDVVREYIFIPFCKDFRHRYCPNMENILTQRMVNKSWHSRMAASTSCLDKPG